MRTILVAQKDGGNSSPHFLFEHFQTRRMWTYPFLRASLLLLLNLVYLSGCICLSCYAQASSSCGKGGVYSSLHCMGFLWWWLLLLQNTGSRACGLQWLSMGFSCSVPCGIFLDQGLNSCPLHWQADSHPLDHRWILIQYQTTGPVLLHLCCICFTCEYTFLSHPPPHRPLAEPFEVPV